MLIEWLNPAIESQIDELAKTCDNDHEIDRLFDEIVYEVNKLKNHNELISKLNRLEKISNLNIRRIIDVSFRSGFANGLGIKDDINTRL